MKSFMLISTLALITASAFGILHYQRLREQTVFQHMYDDEPEAPLATSPENNMPDRKTVAPEEKSEAPQDAKKESQVNAPQMRAEKRPVVHARRPREIRSIDIENYSRGEIMPPPPADEIVEEAPVEEAAPAAEENK